MKNICFILLLLSSGLFSALFSQNYKPKWGPEYKIKKGSIYALNFLGIEGNHYYIQTKPGKSAKILKYDLNSHQLVKESPVNLKYEGKNHYISEIIKTKSGKYGYINSLDVGAIDIFITKFDGNNFTNLRHVHQHKYTVKGPKGILSLDGISRINISSRDRNYFSSIMVSSTGVNVKQKLSIAVFDADFNKVWVKEEMMPYPDNFLTIGNFYINNSGEIYFTAKLIKKETVKDFEKVNDYEFKIFKVSKDGFSEINLILGENIIPNDAEIVFQDGYLSGIIVVGFYVDISQKSGIRGVFWASCNVDTGIEKINIYEFENDFLKDITSKRDLEKGQGLNKPFKIDKLLYFDDGSLRFVSESRSYYALASVSNSSAGKTLYYNDEIISPYFSPTGELISIQKVLKNNKRIKYSSPFTSLRGYSTDKYNGKTYLLFDDSKSGKDRDNMAGKAKGKWIYTDLVVLNALGEIEFNGTIFNSGDNNKMEFSPFYFDSSEGRMLIAVHGEKSYKFGTIDLR